MATLTAPAPAGPAIKPVRQPITDLYKIPDDGVSTMSPYEWFCRLVEGLGGDRSEIQVEVELTDEEIDAY